MLTIELPDGYLCRHERMALERGSMDCGGGYLLPVTIADVDGGTRLIYRTEGCVSFAEYNFHGDLSRLFRALKSYVRKICEAQDMLLRTERIFRSPGKVFLCADSQCVRLVYGERGEAKGNAGAYCRALYPALAKLAEKKEITGAKPAMEQLMAKLRTANPDYEAALRIIESVERRWNYVQPVG
ncbi:MAG: hypothetical protein LBG50_02835, partial [Clostridiales Family XIII bacterium]|nr:hypothetical protein [Clostridiales Family XIII bacterium]